MRDRLDRQRGSPDAFLLYLHGVVLLASEKRKESREAILGSIHAYPCNWAAWQALQELRLDPNEVVDEEHLPNHWMKSFFLASMCLEEQENEQGLKEYVKLQKMFPKSEYVLAQVRPSSQPASQRLRVDPMLMVCFSFLLGVQAATAHYNLRQFNEAQSLFEHLHSTSPHRIEGMDTYSNILYVKESYAALSHLAHHAIVTDKYKPETCCIVGNYYSLRFVHVPEAPRPPLNQAMHHRHHCSLSSLS